jgi:DNA-binding transcriptional regulator YiaG
MKKLKNNEVVEQDIKLDLSLLDNAESYSVEFFDIDYKVNNEFLKNLRKKFGFSQSFMAKILGVSKKTIEKWEQGKNPILGTSSRLLHLINIQPSLLEALFKERKTEKKDQKISSKYNRYPKDFVQAKTVQQTKSTASLNEFPDSKTVLAA